MVVPCSPYLYVFCQYFLSFLDIIMSPFLSTFFIHHANAGLSAIWLSTAYSASCTGRDSLTSLTWFQVEPPYFHCMKNPHPLVVYFFVYLNGFLDCMWYAQSLLVRVPLQGEIGRASCRERV